MLVRILFSAVIAMAAASQAVGQQYYVPEPQTNAPNRGAAGYSMSDTTPNLRPASATIRPAGQEPVPQTAPVGNSYLNNSSAGCCDTPSRGPGSRNNCASSPGGCAGSPGGCAGSPGGCAGSAGGCASSPGGCASSAGGCAASPCGSNACGSNTGGCDSCACPNPPGSRYLKAFGGWNEPYDISVPASNTTFDLNSGFALGAGIGRQVTCNLRREIEFTWRNNTADERVVQGQLGPQITGLDGNINCFSTAQILLYDLHRLSVGGFTPYVGGGAGGAYVDADFTDGVNTYAISDLAFSYHGILGVQRQMGARATAYAEYRYFGTTNLEFETPMNTFDVNYQAQGVFVGLRLAR